MREGRGGRIPTHFLHLEARTEPILLKTYCLVLLFALFCPSEKKLPYFSNFNCFSLFLVQLTTLRLATSLVDVSEWQQTVFVYPYPAPQQRRLSQSVAAEGRLSGKSKSADVNPNWAEKPHEIRLS